MLQERTLVGLSMVLWGAFDIGPHTSGFFVRVDPELHQMVEDFYNRDFNESIVDDKTEMSQDELQFMQNAKETVKLKDGHYQISLRFKDREASVPNNKSQALQCANWLKKKLERDLHGRYHGQRLRA